MDAIRFDELTKVVTRTHLSRRDAFRRIGHPAAAAAVLAAGIGLAPEKAAAQDASGMCCMLFPRESTAASPSVIARVCSSVTSADANPCGASVAGAFWWSIPVSSCDSCPAYPA